jgi:hypothetical protein
MRMIVMRVENGIFSKGGPKGIVGPSTIQTSSAMRLKRVERRIGRERISFHGTTVQHIPKTDRSQARSRSLNGQEQSLIQ